MKQVSPAEQGKKKTPPKSYIFPDKLYTIAFEKKKYTHVSGK